MKNYSDALFQIKRGFLIIGLTGYTGSGCSTAARILASEQKPELPGIEILGTVIDKSRHLRLKNIWNTLDWQGFEFIEVSRIIFLFAIYRALSSNFKHGSLATLRRLALPQKNKFKAIRYLFTKDTKLYKNGIGESLIESYSAAKPLYLQFKSACKYDLAQFIEIMQNFGDDIRKYGVVSPSKKTIHAPKNILILPEAIRRLIKSYRLVENKSRFVIDAFRNPFEVEFFNRRYNEFYLVAIQRKFTDRKIALQGLTEESFLKLEKREKGALVSEKKKENVHEWVTSQNIDECRQKADMFVENVIDASKTFPHLRFNLIKLISLTQKPGCITPKRDERSMQLAISARQNSGCLSRHVGAVVTNSDGFVLGVGWNDPPSGQKPCSLRTSGELINELDDKIFSEYERSDEFIGHIKRVKTADQPFCFCEELSLIKGQKQAEYTRSLHAEENALLQAIRHGSEVVRGGTLYTTDSTCTLCAKKAYHLGIKRIVYIEEYPGIAFKQTIKSGDARVEICQFQGITGSAYFRLFCPLIPEKDFLKLYA